VDHRDPARRARAAETPIEHIVISMMENRSFDHYYGYAPPVQAAGFGPPAGYSQPNPGGSPDPFPPYRFTELGTPDVPHDWDSVHGQWHGGAMDGFMTHSGEFAMGYYTAQELPFYYSLFANSTLCANFFCSLLGPTWPNRFYLMAGTSGGITTNGLWGYGIFDYPMILDLLDAAGVTWKTYNLGMDSVPYGNTDNVAVFWKNFAKDQRTNGSKGGFLNDCRKGRLPQVSFLIPSYARGWDEHPPASVQVGESLMAECVTALRNSPQWGQLGVPDHLRRARRLLRPRPAAAGRRVRARHSRPVLGDLAVREARPSRANALRVRVDPQVPRAELRAADARLGQSPL
jgi:phospholipase C